VSERGGVADLRRGAGIDLLTVQMRDEQPLYRNDALDFYAQRLGART